MIAFAVVAAACAKEKDLPTPAEKVNPDGTKTIVFTAQAPTRTTIDANDQVVSWSAGDEVKFVWDGGSATATASETGSSTNFSVTVPDGVTEVYAVYPAAAGGSYDNGNVNVHFNGSRTDGSFAANDISVAKATKSGDAWSSTLAFKNVACLIKVGVTSSTITKLQVYAGNGETLAGYLPVNIASNGDPSLGAVSSSPSDHVTMEVSGPGNYYIPVIPGVTMSKGFQVKLFEGDDQITPFFYNGEYTTARGKVIKLSNIESHAGQYYVTPSGAGTKSGQSWNNAMDAATFKAFIENADNYFVLRGATIHLSAEEFTFGDYLQPDFSSHSETAFTIEGTKSGSDITTFVGGTGDPAGTLWPHSNSNVTVKNVKFAGTDGNSNRAAIRVNNTGVKLQLEDCIFENNKTSGQSGAINLIKGIVSITNCEFTGNSASTGASVHVENANVTINGCTFANNSGDGNALHCTNTAAVVSMENCDISGGDKCTVYGVNANTVSFTSVNFHDNHTSDENGGAVARLVGAGTYTFTNCDFVNNASDNFGGAIVIASGDVHATFIGGKFQGNHADGVDNTKSAGGAIYASGSGVQFDCSGVLFKSNYNAVGSNEKSGGIIRVESATGKATFDNCVFDGNHSYRPSGSANPPCAAIVNNRTVDGPTYYFNACEFMNNATGTYAGVGAKYGMVFGLYNETTLAFNNCSIHDNYGQRNTDPIDWIYVNNTGVKLIFSNSSVIGDPSRRTSATGSVSKKNGNGVFYLSLDASFYFINNILCSPSGGKSLNCATSITIENSYYNKTSPVNGTCNWGTDTGSGHDYTANSTYFGSWSAPYTWNGTLTGTNSNMLAATADVNSEIQSADADFYAWLNSIGALGKDINGNSRGATSWPGCYQN